MKMKKIMGKINKRKYKNKEIMNKIKKNIEGNK